ncbi:MAG TPA: hypothetical protein VFC93_00955 [Chloroflexota bacterium]|nr:hypothetical protein [Chloroflexota bacterium]
MSARRVALWAFGALAVYELAQAALLTWVRADSIRLEVVGGWFGLDPDTERARLTILIPVALVLGAIDWLVLFGVSRRIPGAARWRRTAFLASGLYALWALAQIWRLESVRPPGVAWLGLDVVVVGGLATLGYAAVGRATAAPLDEAPASFVVYDPAYELQRDGRGLEWQDVELGRGPLASPGRMAVVDYRAYGAGGRCLAWSSAFQFRVGTDPKWDGRVANMREGGRRRVIESGADGPTVYDLELVTVK